MGTVANCAGVMSKITTNMNSPSVAVVFLARGEGGGLASLEDFLKSYRTYPAGLDHDFIVLSKGWKESTERVELEWRLRSFSARIIDLPDDGFDWAAYMRAAPLLSHDYVCFLNTHSRIQAQNWLLKLSVAIKNPDVGAAGATGSFGTIRPVFKNILPGMAEVLSSKGVFKALAGTAIHAVRDPFLAIRDCKTFPAYPNPHLRSNAFLIGRKTFVQFSEMIKMPETKRDAHALESGWRGMTRFLKAHGLKAVVVGADGAIFEPEEWMDSGTFRRPGHPNLLIADNQTLSYDVAEPWSRRLMERSAWGKTFTRKP